MPELLYFFVFACVFILVICVGAIVWFLYEKKQASNIIASLKLQLNNLTQELTQMQPAAKIDSSGELLLELIGKIEEGIIAIDAQGRVLFVNPFAESILGTFFENVKNKSYREVLFLIQKNGTADFSVFEKALSGETVRLESDVHLITRNDKITIRGSVMPFKNATDVVQGIIMVFRDATAEVEKEQESHTFLSQAAHDLRTPLAIIRSSVLLVLENLGKLDAETIKNTLTDTAKSTDQLLALVNDFLNVSRLEQGRMDIKKEPFNLVSLTAEVVAEQLQQAKARKLYLILEETDGAIPKALADKNRTREILTNLISNAIKYTYQGGVTIKLGLRDGHIALQIMDTGVGLAEDQKRLLFRKFMQIGEARTKSTNQSTGLGLYISQQFAELMGGNIELESSEPGNGSTFTLILPHEHI